ncbi:MAG TPA: hypothetical protein VGL08_10865 [Paraburkholderia sp.]
MYRKACRGFALFLSTLLILGGAACMLPADFDEPQESLKALADFAIAATSGKLAAWRHSCKAGAQG